MTVRTLFTKLSFITLSDVQNWGLLDFVTLFTGQDFKHFTSLFTTENFELLHFVYS